MASFNQDEIISVLKSEIEDFDLKTVVKETGRVTNISDGIVTVYGLDEAMYGELVEFETGVRGIVQNLEMKSISCVLLGSDYGITEGSKVVRTKKRAGIPVSDQMLGRVVNALGTPIDGKGDITADAFYPIEREAAGVCDRKSVSTPLQTGILAIDSMFPIGRGQRELIIGDRQTGKTAIATDTIINQKGQDVICIYVAIGQKASTVAKLVSTLTAHGAMDYTIIVNSTASDVAPLQYIAPYSGTAIAEYFMEKGKDVLIIYDDLSKHAVAYRTLSLLLRRPPGREAYPGDVFYLHSRLLERAARLSEEYNGGSITALPIIETLSGDISAYIPTNVISITDGQIFLQADLFASGQRPAIDTGLSVSRVGSNAQIKAIKQVSGTLKIELANFRELQAFSQFGSDLDKTTKEVLDHGSKVLELLKQPQYETMDVYDEVLSLFLVKHRLIKEVPINKINDYEKSTINFIHSKHQELLDDIKEKQAISKENEEKLLVVLEKFTKEYLQSL